MDSTTFRGGSKQATAGRARDVVAPPTAPGSAPSEAPLGIHAKSQSPGGPGWLEWDGICRQFALQSAARELLPRERVRGCLRYPHGSTVDVLYSPALERAAYGGLQTCGSVWLCPVCAARISEHRRKELGAAIAAHQERGGEVALTTFTVRHYRGDDLAETLGAGATLARKEGRRPYGLLGAREYSRTGKKGVRLRERFGVVGSIRALEPTVGENGWHPHLHELLFVAGGVDQAELLGELRDGWARAVKSAGLREVLEERGVTAKFGDLSAAQYVAKFGRARSWGPEHEVAKAVRKTGRRKGRTPVDLLADYCFEGDEEAGSLWRHYGGTFKGRRQLAWSAGLRELLGLELERSDEEIAADVRGYPVLLAQVTSAQWRVVLGNDARGEVLQIASRGDAAGLWLFLRALGC